MVPRNLAVLQTRSLHGQTLVARMSCELKKKKTRCGFYLRRGEGFDEGGEHGSRVVRRVVLPALLCLDERR